MAGWLLCKYELPYQCSDDQQQLQLDSSSEHP